MSLKKRTKQICRGKTHGVAIGLGETLILTKYSLEAYAVLFCKTKYLSSLCNKCRYKETCDWANEVYYVYSEV